MQESYNGNYSFDKTDESQDSGTRIATRIAIWVWPVLGSLAIGIIVVTLLQTPWLQAKMGFKETLQAPETKRIATVTAKPEKPPVEKTAIPDKTAAEKVIAKAGDGKKPPAPTEAKVTVSDIAALRIEMTRIADMLGVIDKAIIEQNGRITRLEKAVGTVTGSISPPAHGGGSSTRAKTTVIRPETAVNSAAKTDLPVKNKPSGQPRKPAVTRTARAVMHQDTGDAIPSASAAKSAARTGGREQFALILARAQKKSTLNAAWEKLIRGKAGELSVLEPRVRGLVTRKGNQVYDLLAGPFAHIADAIELCARLKLEGIKCKQTSYGGEPL